MRHIRARLRVLPLQGRLNQSDHWEVPIDQFDAADAPTGDVADRHRVGPLEGTQLPSPGGEPISIDDQLHIRSKVAHVRDLLGDGEAAARHSRERPKKLCRGVVATCRFGTVTGAAKPLLARSRRLVLG